MNVSFLLGNLSTFMSIRPVSDITPATAPPPVRADQSREELLVARTHLTEILTELQKLAELMGVRTRFRLDLPDAQSNRALGLDLTSTAATLESAEEINALPNSFSPFGPAWSGASTALLTVGGAYDGSNGTGALTFEVRGPGTHGLDNLRIRVRDPLGGVLTNLNIQRSHSLDRQYGLGNGLHVTLGTGDLSDGDTTSVNVFQNIGSVFDPTLPFDGTRNTNPNFHYYDPPNTLASVVDGTFLVNGETISVNAGDTLNDVSSRINASAAGVTAVFNPVTERMEFTQNTEGSVPSIVLEGDTSNLIDAVKLDGAVLVPGMDPDTVKPMSDVAAFAGVSAGSFTVNGTTIALDPASDSLNSVVENINASAAQVTASFDDATQLVLIQADDPASILEIDSNDTGLFAALNMTEGRVDPVAERSGFSRRRSYEIADRLESIAAEMNLLFGKRLSANAVDLDAVRNSLASEFNMLAADTGDQRRGLYGLAFNDPTDGNPIREFASLDRRILTRHLQLRGDEVKKTFEGNENRVGTIDALLMATGRALSYVNEALGPTGTLYDAFA